jgi:bifunctional DNA-binding transcriptional regulator/antitoxin component of YhaV-PrlF toxin-antitoxin module
MVRTEVLLSKGRFVEEVREGEGPYIIYKRYPSETFCLKLLTLTGY